MNFTRISKVKLKIIVAVLISIILMSEVIPFINANEDIDEITPNYLFLNNPPTSNYSFFAKGECYLYAEVENTDYISVELDGEEYILSYGINIFPVEFSENFEEHTASLPDSSSTCIKSFIIEPLYLAEGKVNTSLEEDTDVLFEAGGLVSLLIQPNFSYNWLFVEIDGIIYKKMYNTSDYPKVDSQFYSFFVDQGAYCRFDLNLFPGNHHLILKGNGSIDYKIVFNSDWDEDQITDVDEIQKQEFFDLDPTSPNIWGFFQKSSGEIYWNKTKDPISDKKEGFFNFFIPEFGVYNLNIDLYNGEFSDFTIDGNSSIIENTFIVDYPNTSIISKSVTIDNMGWHYIQYYFKSGYTKISFRLNGKEIKLFSPSELIDSDGDGLKDVEETKNIEGIDSEDTDMDGLPDPFDSSPDSSLTIDKDNITQLLIPTSIDKNSIITFQVKRPENDYSTDGKPRFWRDDLNVSITAVLRLYGNQYQLYEDSPITTLTKDDLTYLWGKEIDSFSLVNEDPDIGDPLPPPSNPNNETLIVHPIPTEKCFEYQIKFPKYHAAKSDGILDLRFEIIWLVTSYTAENGTDLLHYYDMEENLTIQTIIHREIANISYTIGTPDDFVDNQVLWALTQNQQIGSPEKFGVTQDIIGHGIVDYFSIGEVIAFDVDNYYMNNFNQNGETQVLYIAGLYETSDVLSDITAKYDVKSDPVSFDPRALQQYLSFYSINDVYDNYSYGEDQLEGESKSVFQTHYQNHTLLLGMPIDMKVEVFPYAKVLTIIEALSEPIPKEEIPYSINSPLHDNIILQNKTYIVRHRYDEPVPTLHFIPENDEYKEFTDNRANQVESGKNFFENSSTMISKFNVYHYYMDALNGTLGELHFALRYFHSPEGQQQFGDVLFDPFRDFSDILDVCVDTAGSYFIILKKLDTFEKLDFLNRFVVGLTSLGKNIAFLNEIFYEIDVDEIEAKGVITTTINEIKVVKYLKDKLKNGLLKIGSAFKKLGKFLGNQVIKFLKWITPQKLQSIIKEKINHLIDKFKDKISGKGGGFDTETFGKGSFDTFIAAATMYYHVNEHLLLIEKAEGGVYLNDTSQFLREMILSICAITMDAISLFSGVIDLIKAFGKITLDLFESITNFLSYVAIAITVALTIVDWVFFVNDALGGKLTQSEFIIGLTMLIYETMIVIGLVICVALGATVIGAIIGAAFAAYAFISALLCPFLNDVNFDVAPDSGFIIPEETKLNLRRHGSFEQGDRLSFGLVAHIWGTTSVWAISRFRLECDEWIGDWTGWAGRWAMDHRYSLNDLYVAFFINYAILAPTTKIEFSLEFWLDFDQCILLPIFPHILWVRTEGNRQTITESLGMPALENTMSGFYNQTSEIISIEQLKLEYQLALDEYRYKDAYNTAKEIIVHSEERAKITLLEFGEINDNKLEYNETYFSFQTRDANQFSILIKNHFNEGFRAKILIPESERGSIASVEIKYLHMISYEYSEGIIVFPKEWNDTKFEGLKDAVIYTQYRESFVIISNIFLNMEGDLIDIDLSSGNADVNLQFLLEGPDWNNPLVTFTLETSNEFIVTPGTFTQHLKSNLSFTIEDRDNLLQAGMYILELSVFFGSYLIFHRNIPIRIQSHSDLNIEINTPDDPINLGEILNLVNVTNHGTIEEYIELKVEGLPEDFIYTDLYPELFNNFVQNFTVSVGETRQCFVINPPRNYTSTPGEYYFNVTLNKIFTNETFCIYIYQGSLVVKEFYELDLHCSNLNIEFFDNETYSHPFTITNLGNTEDEFTITSTDIGLASSYLEEDFFILAPGQSETFNIILDPLDVGDEMFTITATSEHLSKNLIASMVISDDDIDSPIFAIEAINCVSDEEAGFWRIVAADKSRLHEIGLVIDGENLIFTQADFGNGSNIEILIPINNELGEHRCGGYAIDADLNRGSLDQMQNTHPNVTCNIVDDDLHSPHLANLVILNEINSIFVSFDAIDLSGIREVIITIDYEFKFSYYELSGRSFTFEIFNYWVNATGTHNVEIEVWDSDGDRVDDSMSSLIKGTFKISSGEDPGSFGISVVTISYILMLIGIVSVITLLLFSKRRRIQKKSPP